MPPPPLHLPPKSSCPLRAGGGGANGRGLPCTYLSPLPRSPPDLLYIFTGVPLPIIPPSWLIKSSDWCCVPSLWPLCGGRGIVEGRAGRGPAGPQGLSLGIWSQQETEQQGKGPGYLGWKEGQMLPAWLTAQVPPHPALVPVTSVCHHPQKAQSLSFRLHLLVAQSPDSISKCPQDSWAWPSRTLFPRTLP